MAGQSRKPLEEQIPPPVLASPADPRFDSPERNVPFWRPGVGESLRYLGYRWVFVLPAVATVAILLGGFFEPRLLQIVWLFGFKLVVIAVALPVTFMFNAIRHAVRLRADPFCIHCGYSLYQLPDNYRCPECGRPYSFHLIEEYRRDPHWFIQRWKQRHNIPAGVPFEAGPVRSARKGRDGTS